MGKSGGLDRCDSTTDDGVTSWQWHVFANTPPHIILPSLYDHGFLYHSRGWFFFETAVNVAVESDSDLRCAANGTIERGRGVSQHNVLGPRRLQICVLGGCRVLRLQPNNRCITNRHNTFLSRRYRKPRSAVFLG